MAFQGLGGERGNFIDLVVKPDSTLKTAIDALVAADSAVEGKYVKLATSANMTVSLVANNEIPEGRVIAHEEHDDDGYRLTVRFHCYVDVEGNYHWGSFNVFEFDYGDGTIALGQEVLINGSDYLYVDGVNTGGVGKVVWKDDPSGKVGVAL